MTLNSPHADWDITKSIAFGRYSNLYEKRRPSWLGDRMERADYGIERMYAEPKEEPVCKTVIFNEGYNLDSVNIDIRYFAILDMTIEVETENDRDIIRKHDNVYTLRMPWKRMRMPFLQHIYNQCGYRVVRG